MATSMSKMAEPKRPEGEEGHPSEHVQTLAQRSEALGPTGPSADPLDALLLHHDLKERMFGHAQTIDVGGYEVLRRLGSGGMGAVYSARDPRLEREVALKLLFDDDPKARPRILAEARALAKLAHPNVVTIHEVGEHEGRLFLAMELIDGETLQAWLRTPRPLTAIAAVFEGAAEGLAAAHRVGLVHRDFKPGNVIVGEDTRGTRSQHRVRVVDFGLASVSDASGRDRDRGVPADPMVSRSQRAGGTPAYMAHEQIMGGAIDARTDVFAFSVSLYEALHGARPFTAMELRDLVLEIEAGTASLTWRKDLGPKLVELIAAGLSDDPLRRPPSLDPFIAELGAVARPRLRSTGTIVGLVVAGVVATVGMGMGAYALLTDEAPTAQAPTVGATAVAKESNALTDHVCPADAEPDPRGCDALARRLTAPSAATDWDARCAFRRACPPSITACPRGTLGDGTLGCALPACTARTETDAMDRCAAGDTTCCMRSAYARYDSDTSTPQAKAAIADELARACAAHDAYACANVASIAKRFHDDHDTAVAALVTACGLGFVQACGRIATLAEQREGLRPECTTHPDDSCDPWDDDPVQLAHLAACKTVVFERPGDGVRLVDEFGRADVSLSDGEAAAIGAAQAAVEQWLVTRYRALWRDVRSDEPPPMPALEDQLLDTLHTQAGSVAISRATQRIADTRAGITTTLPRRPPTPLDRWLQIQAQIADRLEDEVATRLGRERATALHRARGVWPGYEIFRMQGRCPD